MQEIKNELPAEDEIDLLVLIGVLFRYKLFIISVTLLAALAAVGFSILSLVLPPETSLLPNLYRGQAMVLVQNESNGDISNLIASSGLGSLAGLAGVSTGQSYGELAVKLLKSKSLLDNIADEFHLIERYEIKKHVRAESREQLLKNSEFEHDDKTNTLSIGFKDYDPQFAARVTNRMVDLLAQRFSTIGGNRDLTKKTLLEHKLADVTKEMARLEARIQAFQENHGVLTVEDLAAEQVTVLAGLRSQLILKEMEIKTYSDFSTIEDPILKRLKSERESLLLLVREVEEGFSSFEKVMPPLKELPELALEFSHLKRDLEVQAKIYEILTQQYELAKLSLEAADPIFQVLELAEVPDKKSGPRRSMICAVTVFVVFFLSIICAFILNAVKNIRNDPEKMKKLRGIEG